VYGIALAAGIAFVLVPGSLPNYAGALPLSVLGWIMVITFVPMLGASLADVCAGGPQLKLAPTGLFIRRPLWRQLYGWDEIDSFQVETKRSRYFRFDFVSFRLAIRRPRSFVSWFFGRESVLKSPAGMIYPYAMPPADLASLLNGYAASRQRGPNDAGS